MSLHSIVRFDSETVQVLTFRHKGAAVQSAITISIGDFGNFLAADRSTDYQIIVDATEAQYDIITIPPVEPKLVTRIAQIEFRRLYPEYPPFTASYRPIDEVTQDGKTLRRVACCMVSKEYLDYILEPFIRHNKSVSLISTLPTALAQLVDTTPETHDRPHLYAYDGNHQKCIFLLEKGCVTMVRFVPSAGAGWGEADILNVNMTLDYCFQTLRVKPAKTIALNGAPLQPPLTPLTPKCNVAASDDLHQEYLPHLAVMTSAGMSKEDLRPQNYITALKYQNLLRGAVWVFSIGALAASLLGIFFLFSILSLQSEIDSSRQREHAIPALLSSYNALQQERNLVEPNITTMNRLQSGQTLPELLAVIPELSQKSVRVNSLKTDKTGGAITLILSGTITENTFAAAQSRFEEILQSLSKLQGFTISSQQFEQLSKTFTIETKSTP
ncbi:MAG: hypothetical protein PHP95_10155 [Desulfuromonadaceae bacterium]|nr:hypothetical protein [Desulfuromonadaceae bacterium]MDD2848806.1 hypothetical protein [Desulfuromonadaceae bacterium]MDD4130456.1 hypothetical protein [Desulfuromonadaceae bacterium]